MATSLRSWIKSARSASKKSGIRSAPRRRRLVSNHCGIGHLAGDLNRTGSLWAEKLMLRFLLRFLGLACLISQGHVMTNNAFIYRRPSKWPIVIALTAAVLDSLVRGGNCLPSGITGHTTSGDRSYDHRSLIR